LTMPPEVTVVIPTHNRWQMLERTLTTVLAQRDVVFEVIVIDDGSQDQTSSRLKASIDPRVKSWQNHVAQGVAAARNSGIALARGEWVAFIDDDDLWAPDKLAAQLRAARSRPEADWVVVGEVTVNRELQVRGARRPPRRREYRQVLRYHIVPAGGSGMMARTHLLRRLGGFNPDLAVLADWDLWIRLFLAAPGADVSRPLVAYRVHPDSMSHDGSRLAGELKIVVSSYESARREHRVPFLHLMWLQWLCRMELQKGNRRRAVRIALESLGHVDELPAFAPVVVNGLRRRRSRRYWRRELEAWLAPLRSPSAE
jgi:glycosyltransferase involved in cell wall biosynthesis